MQSLGRAMAEPRLVKLIAESEYSKCTVCGIIKTQAIYRFRHQQYVPSYVPSVLEPVCRKCVYREVYGNKTFNKKMKERTLDGKE
jgi:hypothetical protein